MNGIENEIKFVEYLNNKKINEVNPIMQELIKNLYGENIDGDLKIKCFKNKLKQKSDIFIEIDNEVKGISIKEGSRNSVHAEPISCFIHFLIENNVPKNIIMKYLEFHYADGTHNGKGKNRISVEEYKKNNQNDIDLINSYFNNEKLLYKIIDRFILLGNNSNIKIDALIYGNVDDFMWLSRSQIVDILIKNKDYESGGVHFSKLFCQPQTRNLNFNPLYERKRFCIQIKWFSLFDDIIMYKAGLI